MAQKVTGTAKPAITVIGAGAVGKSLAKSLKKQGFSACSLVGKDRAGERRFARALKISYLIDLRDLDQNGGIIIIAVQDSQIRTVVQQLSALKLPWTRLTVLHTSGVLGSEPLRPLARRGAGIAAWHPYQTFPKRGRQIPLTGVTFGITGNTRGEAKAAWITRAMGGIPIRIPARKRALYHASAVFACGFVAANLSAAVEMLRTCGLSEKQAQTAALTIARQTLDNVESLGSLAAITGPAVRGDRETIRKHLRSLHESNPAATSVYKAQCKLTCEAAPRAKRRV